MGKFKEILAEIDASRATAQADGFHERFAIYHFDPADRVADVIVRLLLNEEKKYVDLGKGRALMFHKAHVPNTEDHLHFMVKGDKVAALNKTGTAHDQSHGYQMQKWALAGVKKHYWD